MLVFYLAGDRDDEIVFGIEIRFVVKQHLLGEGGDILCCSDYRPSETIVSEIIGLPFYHSHRHRIVFVHLELLDDHSFLPFQLFGIEFRVIHHVRQDVDGSVDEFRGAFDVISGVFVAGIGVEFPSELVYCLGDRFRGRIFFASFEEKMLQKVADSVVLPVFVDASCLAHDLYGDGISIFHRCEQAIYACDLLYRILHDMRKMINGFQKIVISDDITIKTLRYERFFGIAMSLLVKKAISLFYHLVLTN